MLSKRLSFESPAYGSENLVLHYYVSSGMLYFLQTGATPLYVASQNNNKEVVQLLVASGANLNLATQVRTWFSS